LGFGFWVLGFGFWVLVFGFWFVARLLFLVFSPVCAFVSRQLPAIFTGSRRRSPLISRRRSSSSFFPIFSWLLPHVVVRFIDVSRPCGGYFRSSVFLSFGFSPPSVSLLCLGGGSFFWCVLLGKISN
jgi:hypothetical protein